MPFIYLQPTSKSRCLECLSLALDSLNIFSNTNILKDDLEGTPPSVRSLENHTSSAYDRHSVIAVYFC